MPSAVFKLSPGIQSYAWGKKGSASLAAQLAQVSVEGFGIDEDKTYAEVSMSTRLFEHLSTYLLAHVNLHHGVTTSYHSLVCRGIYL